MTGNLLFEDRINRTLVSLKKIPKLGGAFFYIAIHRQAIE
jgi:hypothetical protein